jgi:hypothetical protein
VNEVTGDSLKTEKMAGYFMENEKINWAEKVYLEARSKSGKEMHLPYNWQIYTE